MMNHHSRKVSQCLFALVSILGLASPQIVSAAVTSFDDRPAFDGTLAGFGVTEDFFDDPIVAGDTIVFDSGVISVNSEPSLQASDNSVGSGVYQNTVALGGIAPDEITWTFPEPVSAFGFDIFGVVPNGLQVTIDDGMGLQSFILADIIDGAGDGFVGFFSDGSFSHVVFSTALVPTDGFALDNLAFASAPSEVPVPAALPLMIAGLTWLRYATKRQRGYISANSKSSKAAVIEGEDEFKRVF